MFFKKGEQKQKTENLGIIEDLKNRAITELAYFLFRKWHFPMDEAMKASQEFWKKYEKKLSEVVGFG